VKNSIGDFRAANKTKTNLNITLQSYEDIRISWKDFINYWQTNTYRRFIWY